MGCYDMILFKCPKCGEKLNAQSKSGACAMREFNHDEVPMDVALDANRHAPFECSCGARLQFEEINIPEKVSLKIIQLNK